MNTSTKSAIQAALNEYAGEQPSFKPGTPKPGGLAAKPAIQAAISQALKTLEAPEPIAALPLGSQQVEVKRSGDVLSTEIVSKRDVSTKKTEGNITPGAFERVW